MLINAQCTLECKAPGCMKFECVYVIKNNNQWENKKGTCKVPKFRGPVWTPVLQHACFQRDGVCPSGTVQGLSITLATNTIGPLVMAKHFAPLLRKGTGAFGHQFADQAKQHRAILVNLTAKVGSIGDNALGGWYSYRMSKAALNMATKNLSIELGRGKTKVVCVSLHPGTVNTDLSKPYHRNVPKDKLFTPDYSVNCLMNIIENLDMGKTGKFFAWDGSALPW
ncbi:C-signal-like isoform 2-T2 [Pangshura tecta]